MSTRRLAWLLALSLLAPTSRLPAAAPPPRSQAEPGKGKR
jgi:hypothetical protein